MEISTFFLAGMVGAYGVLHHLVLLFLSIGASGQDDTEEQDIKGNEKPFSVRNYWYRFNYDFGYSAGQSFGYVFLYSLLSYWLVGQWQTWELQITEITYNEMVIHTPTMILFALLSAAAGASWYGGSSMGDGLGSLFSMWFDAVFSFVELMAQLTGRENKENTAAISLLAAMPFVALIYYGWNLFAICLFPVFLLVLLEKLETQEKQGTGIYKMSLSEFLQDKLQLKVSGSVKKIFLILILCWSLFIAFFLTYLWVGML